MQGVFDYVPLVDVTVLGTGYASPYAILTRFSSPRSRLLVLPCLVLRQTIRTRTSNLGEAFSDHNETS